jgi:hypothetical protein
MGSTLKHILLLVIALLIGIGITYMGVSLMEGAYVIDQTLQIIFAVVLTIFAYVALYFMTKGSG